MNVSTNRLYERKNKWVGLNCIMQKKGSVNLKVTGKYSNFFLKTKEKDFSKYEQNCCKMWDYNK